MHWLCSDFIWIEMRKQRRVTGDKPTNDVLPWEYHVNTMWKPWEYSKHCKSHVWRNPPPQTISRIRTEIILLTLKGHCSRHSQRIWMIKSENWAKFPALFFKQSKRQSGHFFSNALETKGACGSKISASGSKISACESKQNYSAFGEKFACWLWKATARAANNGSAW